MPLLLLEPDVHQIALRVVDANVVAKLPAGKRWIKLRRERAREARQRIHRAFAAARTIRRAQHISATSKATRRGIHHPAAFALVLRASHIDASGRTCPQVVHHLLLRQRSNVRGNPGDCLSPRKQLTLGNPKVRSRLHKLRLGHRAGTYRVTIGIRNLLGCVLLRHDLPHPMRQLAPSLNTGTTFAPPPATML